MPFTKSETINQFNNNCDNFTIIFKLSLIILIKYIIEQGYNAFAYNIYNTYKIYNTFVFIKIDLQSSTDS